MKEPSPIFLTPTQTDAEKFKRLDQYIAANTELSRSQVKVLFERGRITWASSLKLKLELKMPPNIGSKILISPLPPSPTQAKPEDIPLNILFEDEFLLIVNKPAGMVTHPAPGHYTGTLVNALVHHYQALQNIGSSDRPGIVHRLDKGTSGIMVVAKTEATHRLLIKMFSTHDLERRYICLLMGSKIKESGTLHSIMGRHPKNRLKMTGSLPEGKNAITHFQVLERFDAMTLVEMKLETGRTHQIRVHLSEELNYPILMDPLYGHPKNDLNRLGIEFRKLIADYPHPFLHAKLLAFTHPITQEKLRFEIGPPKIFQELLNLLRNTP